MSRKYKFSDSGKLYFITYAVVHWRDVFTRPEYKNIIVESWKYCQEHKGLEIYAWVIMTNHVHLIIGSNKNKPEDIVRDMKSHTSTQLRKAISNNIQESRREWMLRMMTETGWQNSNNKDWQFWQQHNQPIELFNAEIFQQKLAYIHQNPVKAGFVENAEDWLYSSARDFYGKKGLIELSYIV
jgi:putative transposase